MPYDKRSDLPAAVRENLPPHAQDIFKEAYNSAWETYGDPAKRRDEASREETAMKVAWSAVKSRYEKRGDKWVAKDK